MVGALRRQGMSLKQIHRVSAIWRIVQLSSQVNDQAWKQNILKGIFEEICKSE